MLFHCLVVYNVQSAESGDVIDDDGDAQLRLALQQTREQLRQTDDELQHYRRQVNSHIRDTCRIILAYKRITLSADTCHLCDIRIRMRAPASAVSFTSLRT